MTVLLPDGTYELRRRRETVDESRTPVASYPDAADWTGDGYSQQRPDRSYAVALDVAAWPLKFGDLLKLPGGQEVLVRTANLTPSDPDPAWDEVRAVDATAVLRHLAQLDRESQGG